MEKEKKVDLGRVQKDIEKRRINQEMREREAQAEREAKELDGCTFAPQLMTKKKKRPAPRQQQTATVSLSISENVQADHEREQARELNKFLHDQKRFEERKKQNQMKAL